MKPQDMERVAERLEPCPFCGGNADLNDYTAAPVGAWVLSHKRRECFLRIVESFSSEKAARDAWNRRAPPPALPAAEARATLVEERLKSSVAESAASVASDLTASEAQSQSKGAIQRLEFSSRGEWIAIAPVYASDLRALLSEREALSERLAVLETCAASDLVCIESSFAREDALAVRLQAAEARASEAQKKSEGGAP